jgi:hypothetical protein
MNLQNQSMGCKVHLGFLLEFKQKKKGDTMQVWDMTMQNL